MTYLSVVFGELVPKALTLDRAERLAALVAPPIELMARVLRPVVWVLQGSAAFAAAAVRRDRGDRRRFDPLGRRAARARGRGREQSGVIPRAQEELLHNVFDFPDREVRDVMTPALDVVWLDAGLTPDEALDRVPARRTAATRSAAAALDRLEGVVHVRDLIAGARRRERPRSPSSSGRR